MNQYTVDGNKLRQMPDKKVTRKISRDNVGDFLDEDAYLRESQKYLDSLAVYDIDPADWVGVKEVGEDGFTLHKQMMTSPSHLSNMIQIWEDCAERTYIRIKESNRRIIARPKREEQKVEKPFIQLTLDTMMAGGNTDNEKAFFKLGYETAQKEIERLKGLLREVCVRANIILPEREPELDWFDEEFKGQHDLILNIGATLGLGESDEQSKVDNAERLNAIQQQFKENNL